MRPFRQPFHIDAPNIKLAAKRAPFNHGHVDVRFALLHAGYRVRPRAPGEVESQRAAGKCLPLPSVAPELGGPGLGQLVADCGACVEAVGGVEAGGSWVRDAFAFDVVSVCEVVAAGLAEREGGVGCERLGLDERVG